MPAATAHDIPEGGTDPLQVVATNALGRVILPLPDAVVVSANGNQLSDVDLATGNFTFTATVDGADNLVATVSGVDSPPFPENVVPDNTVAEVVIQPQVANVAVQRRAVQAPPRRR